MVCSFLPRSCNLTKFQGGSKFALREFDFKKYESFARDLSKTPSEENIRNAISRGYYSMFHRLKVVAGLMQTGFGTHERIIEGIKRNPDTEDADNFARTLKNLHQDRVYADYHKAPPHPYVFNTENLKRFWTRFKMLEEFIQKANQK
jgi:uncharacterized protein (UPF0332 family)